MSFLLDTNIVSAHLRKKPDLTHRFLQYSGRLHISTITLAELYTWANRRGNPQPVFAGITEILSEVRLLDFDKVCAERFGTTRGHQLKTGSLTQEVDLFLAATALAHDLTLVTHNTKDFANIPGLRVEDWIAS